MSEKSKYYVGDKEEYLQDEKLNEVKKNIQRYLEIENVSFLFGTGASFHLGVKTIRDFPKEIEEGIVPALKNDFEKAIIILQKNDEAKIKRNSSGNIDTPYEDIMDFFQAIKYVQEKGESLNYNKVDEIIIWLKKGLLELCDVTKTTIHPSYDNDNYKKLKDNRFFYHELFVRKICQRPLNLRRANIFTTNYDLAFEYAFDNTATHYIDGFEGFHNRYFRPEVYDYDLFFPGATTQGKVHRLEKVVRYFKLHGSLSWISDEISSKNIYGIKEVPISMTKDREGDLVVYPSCIKKRFVLDFPYSELFRHFANTIKQQQSVLFTIGYSFNDEHINDIINQALTIPSFTLIIVDLMADKNPKIQALKELDDKRIIIISGEKGAFTDFVKEVLPDIQHDKIEEKIEKTVKKLFKGSGN